MKTKLIVGAAALAMSATASFAAVELSGDGRMGIIYDGTDWAFTSRARVKFTLSGTADNGLEFGGSFRADNAGGASGGTAGEVFLKGTFGTISMGDVDGAAAAAMGQTDGVGLTGLGDLNEITFIANGGTDSLVFDAGFPGQTMSSDPSMLYSYSMNNLGFFLSLTGRGSPFGYSADPSIGIAASYTMNNYKVALGYEQIDVTDGTTDWTIDQVSLGADATFGAVTLKARIASGGAEGTNGYTQDNDQWSVSATYAAAPMSLTVFTSEKDFGGVVTEASGLGASYDLGGGLSLKGGVVDNGTDTVADFGVSMTF